MVCGFHEQDGILIRSRKIMDSNWEKKVVRKEYEKYFIKYFTL